MIRCNTMNGLRVTVQQPALPHYRIPFFKELSERSGIDLCLFYGESKGLKNHDPDGFKGCYVELHTRKIFGLDLKWHRAQLLCADSKQSDIAILCGDVQYLSLIPTLLIAKINKIPVIFWTHGYSKNEQKWRKYIRTKILRMADALVFYSYNVEKDYCHSGWPNEKLFVAANSLDQSQIQKAKHSCTLNIIRKHKAQYNLTKGPNLIYVGRVYSENRLEVLLNALVNLILVYPDIKLVIIGKVEKSSELIKQLASDLGLNKHIIWKGPIYSEKELAPWMMSADIFCYPANIGLSVMHALGYGLPVVTSDNIKAHNPEIDVLQEGNNALFYEDSNAKSLSEKIQSMYEDKNKLKEMSLAACASVEKKYNIPQMVDGFVKAITYVDNKSKIISD